MADALDTDDIEQPSALPALADGETPSHFVVVYNTELYLATPGQVKTLFTPSAGKPPTVTLSAPATVTVGNRVSLTATPAAVAPATVATVDFFVGATKLGTATGAPWAVDWAVSADQAGDRVLTAIVTDSLGLQATSAVSQVEVRTPVVVINTPPTITLSAPKTAVAGQPIPLIANAKDADGAIQRVEFFNYSDKIGEVTVGSPYSFSYNPTPPTTPGTLVLSAKATDNLGLSATTQGFAVSITSAVIAPTVPDPPTNLVATAGNNTVGLNATPPTNDGGSGLSGYNVYRNGSTTALATNVSLPYFDTTAVNGTAYYYNLKAVNVAGASVLSAPSGTVTPSAPAAPSFDTTLNPGDNVSTVTFNAALGTQFKFNIGTLSSNTDPNPATMLLFAPDGTTQIGQVDYNGADNGVACAIVYNGTTYYKTFTNGNITLS